jgi:pimeloyl-ACP methyl ester carboxylesterase
MSPRPRLVLVHGTRLSGAQWDLPPYRALAGELDVRTPDLPGHGSRAGEPFTTDAAVAAVEEAVESGDPRAPVVVAGHSLGGYMATAYAARHPERLGGLVLVGASAVPRGPGAAAYRGFAALLGRVGEERVARVTNRVLCRLTGPEVYAAVTAGGSSYAATAEAWEAVMTGGGPEQLRAVRAPVLVVGGGLDQLAVHARRYAACCRDGRVVIVPWASHLLPLTRPQVVAALLRDFTREVTARAGEDGPATMAPP